LTGRLAEIVKENEMGIADPEFLRIDHLLDRQQFQNLDVETDLFLNLTNQCVLAGFAELNVPSRNGVQPGPLVRFAKKNLPFVVLY
jgi:hypothetical protein